MEFNIDTLLTDDLRDLRKLFQANGFDLRFVGGCVRDTVAGRTPKDVDLSTDADPQEQIDIYQRGNIRYIPTGIDHGTITVVLNDRSYEITSLRLDVATDGRRATVKYTRDWTEDAARRDFTINAMSFTFDGMLVDPFGGREDLSKGVVRFVGDADQRIREDYLRILRWFRFRARFGASSNFNYEDITVNAAGLESISRERVWSEIKQILSGPHGPTMMLDMQKLGCHAYIGLPQTGEIWFDEATQIHERMPDPIVLLFVIYGVNHLRGILKNWKASKEEQDYGEFIISNFGRNFDGYYMLAVDEVRRDWVLNLATMLNLNEFDLFILRGWSVPEFPVNGYDLIKLGMKPGPQYKKAIRSLKDVWARNGFKSSKEELLEHIDPELLK